MADQLATPSHAWLARDKNARARKHECRAGNRIRRLPEEPGRVGITDARQGHPVEYESRCGTARKSGDGGCATVTPLGPGSVVDTNVRVAEQVGQHEPGGGGSAADGAVHDDVADRRNGDRPELPAEFVDGPEPASLVVDVVDRQVNGGGNMPGATRRLGCPGRPEPLAPELGQASDIDYRRRSPPDRS